MSVLAAVVRELERYEGAPEWLREVALSLACDLDGDKPAPASAKQLMATMAVLAATAAPAEVSKVDQLAARRAERLAGASNSDVSAVDGERGA